MDDRNKKLPGYQGPFENTWERFSREAQKKSIYKALVFPFTFEEINLSKANEYILEAYEKNQELIIPFFLISEHLPLEGIDTSIVHGIKEHFYLTRNKDVQAYFRIYDFLEHKGLFLLSHPHMDERVSRIKLIKKNFPRLKIILAHAGRKWPFTGDEVLEKIIPELKVFEDVYLDTSTIRDKNVIEGMVKRIGSERILFGSDYPFSTGDGEDVYDKELAVIEEANITDKHKEKMLYKNFKELFLKDYWIRRVSRQDKDKIAELFNSLTKKERKFLALDKKIDLIKANIRDERHIYILENKNQIVGFLRESGRNNKGAIIEEIVVNREYRGQGYAKVLMEAVGKKFNYVEAKTFAENVSINRLNEKLGYRIVKQSTSGTIYYWRKDNDS